MEVGLDPHVVEDADRLKWNALSGYLGVDVGVIEEAWNRKFIVDKSGRKVRDVRWVRLKEEIDEGTSKDKGIKGKGVVW